MGKNEIGISWTIKGFENRGFKVEKYNIPISTINIVAGTLTILSIIVWITVCRLLWGHVFFPTSLISATIYVAIMIVLHELLHAIGFTIRRRIKWKGSIKFGFNLNRLFCYCIYLKPLPLIDYLIGALFPFAVLGIGLFVISIIIGSKLLLLASICNFLACTGDLMLFHLAVKKYPSLILEHPTDVGFIALYEQHVDQ